MKPTVERPIAVGIFGHYGNENLGDEAIISAVIQQVRKRIPEATLYGFSLNPDDTKKRHNIESYAIRRTTSSSASEASSSTKVGGVSESQSQDSNLETAKSILGRTKGFVRRIPVIGPVLRSLYALPSMSAEFIAETIFLVGIYRLLKKVDVLIVAGSNQFLDSYGGPWGFPYPLSKWSLLSKLARCRVCYLSVGANPIASRLSKLLIRSALKFVPYVSCRDESSKKIVKSIKQETEVKVYPDLAFGLDMPNQIPKSEDDRSKTKRITIGINPMPVYDGRYWYVSDTEKYECYTTIIAQAAREIIEQGYELYFFGTQPTDYNVIDDVVAKMRVSEHNVASTEMLVHRMGDVDGLIADLRKADIIVATRFHGVVLSLALEKPVVAISYYRKTQDLMNESGLGEYAISVDELATEELLSKLRLAIHNREEVENILARKIPEYREAVAYQYDHIFNSLKDTDIR